MDTSLFLSVSVCVSLSASVSLRLCFSLFSLSLSLSRLHYCPPEQVVTYLDGHTRNPPDACGIFVFRSTDKPHYGSWSFLGTVATEAQFPGAGEGPNEHAISLLADGSTLTVVFRLDNGDGDPLHPTQAKQSPYHQSFSSDNGLSWSLPKAMSTVDGVPMGCARPRLHLLDAGGPLLLVGGRNVVGGRGDAILWVNANGDARDWVEHSLSGWHNALLPPARQSWAFSPMVSLVRLFTFSLFSSHQW